MVRFGPAGNGEAFYKAGFKRSEQAPAWLREMGLNAYEYQCGQGVRIGKETAKAIKDEAEKYDIAMSVHAPYFINLASTEQQKIDNSVMYIMQTLEAAKNLGASRIVFHPGGCGKMSRDKAMELALGLMPRIIREADEGGYGNITICPEVMGKINQLGNVEEVIDLCSLDERLIPTFDFGHINARTHGGLKTAEDFDRLMDMVENKLGVDRMRNLHVHFSRIQFSTGGEVRHWNYCDVEYGPDFEPLAEVIQKRDMSPVIICESAGNQAEDALEFKRILTSYTGEKK